MMENSIFCINNIIITFFLLFIYSLSCLYRIEKKTKNSRSRFPWKLIYDKWFNTGSPTGASLCCPSHPRHASSCAILCYSPRYSKYCILLLVSPGLLLPCSRLRTVLKYKIWKPHSSMSVSKFYYMRKKTDRTNSCSYAMHRGLDIQRKRIG